MIDLRCSDVDDMLASLPWPPELVIADPPWKYRNFSETIQGAAAAHYGGLPADKIAATVASTYDLAAENCYLVVWCTFPKLLDWMAQPLGDWQYISGGAWGKTNGLGVGFHLRGDAELVLLYKKGEPRPLEHTSNLWLAPRIGHSEKPQHALRSIVRTFCPSDGLVLDLYAGASASLARACRETGRHYVGAEIDPARHEQAMCRLSQLEMALA